MEHYHVYSVNKLEMTMFNSYASLDTEEVNSKMQHDGTIEQIFFVGLLVVKDP